MAPFTVLIVDDDADMRLYLRSCLRSVAPWVELVLEAADGLEALPLAGAVDLLIADVRLPRLDGVALCRALKRDAALRHVPVLLISGEAHGAEADTEANGFLAKPFNARQLGLAVERLLVPQQQPPDHAQ